MSVQPDPSPASGILAPARAPALAALQGVRHGFFGREGGVSTGDYASLNAGPGSGDAPANVAENRRRIAAAFGIAPTNLLCGHQTHSAIALSVSGPWPGDRPEADGLVTATPGVSLAILTADCAPILLADPKGPVIGAAHAGWKGALAGIVESTIVAMEALGAARDRIFAAIGPCIQQPSYEVGPEFQERFLAADADNERFFAPGADDRLMFDLSGYAVARLQQAGVHRIERLDSDTFAAPQRFFSNRRAVKESLQDYGRNCSSVMIEVW